MAAKKPGELGEFLLFDVLYDDGTRSSNRKVPTAELRDWEFDESVRAAIEAQDRAIAERSGQQRAAIKTITRSGTRKAERARQDDSGRKRSSAR
jgi:hypothetical protein